MLEYIAIYTCKWQTCNDGEIYLYSVIFPVRKFSMQLHVVHVVWLISVCLLTGCAVALRKQTHTHTHTHSQTHTCTHTYTHVHTHIHTYTHTHTHTYTLTYIHTYTNLPCMYTIKRARCWRHVAMALGTPPLNHSITVYVRLSVCECVCVSVSV